MALAQRFQVAVIGGGVLGCSILRELQLRGMACVLLERNPSLVSEVSASNTGILCTGYDAPEGSLERKLLLGSARSKLLPYVKQRNIPHRPSGAMVVAWTADELPGLQEVLRSNQAVDTAMASWISADELYRREPMLAPGAVAAVHLPDETVLDSNLLPLSYAIDARLGGAEVRLNTTVTGAVRRTPTGPWTLTTSSGQPVTADIVVNVAGLGGANAEALHIAPWFEMKPRKGCFLVFEPGAAGKLHSPIQCVPSQFTKGVMVYMSAYGHLVIGPTAQDVPVGTPQDVEPAVQEQLHAQAHKIAPALAQSAKLVGMYAGLRPATQFRDYQIRAHSADAWVTVAGVRSTGVSCSLGIAQHVAGLIEQENWGVKPAACKLVTDWQWDVSTAAAQYVTTGCISMHGHQYQLNHPLSQMGLRRIVETPSHAF